MLPTFSIPLPSPGSTTAGDSSTNLMQGLLPDSAVEPTASFASELKLRAPYPLTPPPQSGELPAVSDVRPPDLAEMLQADGDFFPGDGKSLPLELKQIIAELKGLDPSQQEIADADVIPRPGELPVLERQPLDNVQLPPGLRFESEFKDSAGFSGVVELDVEAGHAAAAVDPRVAAAIAAAEANIRPAQDLSPRVPLVPGTELRAGPLPATAPALAGSDESPVEQLARLARVPAARLEQVLERRQVSTSDLQRMVDSINQRLQAAERLALAAPGAAAELPQAAPLVRVDGSLMDGKAERFRTLGVGQPTPTVVELELSEAGPKPLSQPRGDVVTAELLHRDAINTIKPQSATAQVHAPGGQAAPTQFSTQPGAQTAAADGARTLIGTLDVPVQDPSWGEKLGERVLMMANNRQQNIDLRLSPAELGPLRVKVSMEDGTASVSFVAQHALTRDAIEQAMPRLRTLLEQNGIDLGQASVDQRPAEQFSGDAGADGDGSSADGGWGDEGGRGDGAEDRDAVTRQRVSRGLLDTFV